MTVGQRLVARIMLPFIAFGFATLGWWWAGIVTLGLWVWVAWTDQDVVDYEDEIIEEEEP